MKAVRQLKTFDSLRVVLQDVWGAFRPHRQALLTATLLILISRQESLQQLMRNHTSFVIAQRLSTVHNADQILVVEAGHLIEIGNHESLYAARGRYYELYTKQFRNPAEPTPLVASLG